MRRRKNKTKQQKNNERNQRQYSSELCSHRPPAIHVVQSGPLAVVRADSICDFYYFFFCFQNLFGYLK